MKELNELNFPDDLHYTEDHEWAQKTGKTVKVGVTDYAQDQLGDIVFVELPEIGDVFDKGEEFGSLESVKAVSEIYMPISGEIVAVNEDLAESPELINEECYDNWIIEVKPSDISELKDLMSADDYLEMLKG